MFWVICAINKNNLLIIWADTTIQLETINNDDNNKQQNTITVNSLKAIPKY